MNRIGNLVLRNELKNYLEKAILKNEKFSIRSFAKKVSVDSGTISRFLQGKRDLTSQVALKIINKINIGKERQQNLKKLFLSKMEEKQIAWNDHPIMKFWYYYASKDLLENKTVIRNADCSEEIIGEFHSQILNSNSVQLNNSDDERQMSLNSMCVTCDGKQFPEVEKIIKRAMEDIRVLLSDVEKKDVYILNIQFYPVTPKD